MLRIADLLYGGGLRSYLESLYSYNQNQESSTRPSATITVESIKDRLLLKEPTTIETVMEQSIEEQQYPKIETKYFHTQSNQQLLESDSDEVQQKVSVERPKLKKRQQILEIREARRVGKNYPQSTVNLPIKLTALNRSVYPTQSKATTEKLDQTPIFGQLVDTHPIPNNDNLRSERGIDYKKLLDLLAAGKWEEADQETIFIMLKLSRRSCDLRSWEGWLRVKDIRRLPCKDISTIDKLWVKYSNGRFGFSVQKLIYDESKSPSYCVSMVSSYEIFCKRVEWRIENPQISQRLHRLFSLDAPQGHLPGNMDWWCGVNGGPNRFSYFMHKLSECRIGITEQSAEQHNEPDHIPF